MEVPNVIALFGRLNAEVIRPAQEKQREEIEKRMKLIKDAMDKIKEIEKPIDKTDGNAKIDNNQ